MEHPKIKEIQKLIGIKFKDTEILTKAFIHRSYLNESQEETDSNERLEFLGDAVLQFITSKLIFKTYKNLSEGQMTNLRAKIVNTESLASEAVKLNLSQFLLISKGEQETAHASNYILADTFEALLGAIYIDKGIETCEKFLDKHLFYKMDEIIKTGELKDHKSLYQEIAQEKFGITPSYRLIEDTGPDHHKTFRVGIYLNSKLIAEGTGPSKRKAQQEAAKNALENETTNSKN